MRKVCFLVLEDGAVYPGKSFGSPAVHVSKLHETDLTEKSAGEVVFNTGMAGYHEILTDPSYTGQIVAMTYPMIGNYGCDDSWSEVGPEGVSRSGIKPAGFAVRNVYSGPLPDGRISIDAFLKQHGTPGISDIDTRELTIRIRDGGSPNGLIVASDSGDTSLSEGHKRLCLEVLKQFPRMEGRNLIGNVGTVETVVENPGGSPHFLLLDCGIKANIIAELKSRDCKVTIIPSNSGLDEITSVGADAMLFSSGPGDPAVLNTQVELIQSLIHRMPVFGICLGHQLISLALGAKTAKMKFGHHGVNHPVRDEFTGRVFVTSQNHGFEVVEESLPNDVEIWFRNANDGTIEGIRHKNLPVMCAQFHPEAAPGPRDSSWVFQELIDSLVDAKE